MIIDESLIFMLTLLFLAVLKVELRVLSIKQATSVLPALPMLPLLENTGNTGNVNKHCRVC